MLLIGQFNYTTTLRYSFPQEDETPNLKDLKLPHKFVELSLASLHSIRGRLLQVEAENFLTTSNEFEDRTNAIQVKVDSLSAHLTPLKPIKDNTPIVAVDVSSVKLGETDVGVLCAVRGAIVWSIERKYSYLRIGPFPFHVTEENFNNISRLLKVYNFLSSGICRLEDIQNKLSNLVERWLQMSVCSMSYGNIILLDGSLTVGTPDNPLLVLRNILEEARKRENKVLAISKMTGIRILGRRITDLVSRYPPPCLFKVNELKRYSATSIRILGDVYIAKLAEGFSAFRLDIDKGLSGKESLNAVRRLLGNDIVYQGYPETLRLAHILSTFTASEVIGVQHYLAHKYNLRVIARPSVRKILFGPYGTRLEN
ncbi:TPA: DNA double-strand break repair nuclease NurA [Candidatus Bathyarchaeota archaeon]|nr:DNA double-strand break repair nuclease NurA [Candidatus Bathyarchaeota archaeon]